MHKIKYLTISVLPVSVWIAFSSNGWITYLPLIIFFIFVPGLELLFNPDASNLEDAERKLAQQDPFYDWILFLMLPIQLALIGLFFYSIQETGLSSFEVAGRITSLGMMCGVFGINIGHELGHRSERFPRLLGEILLLTSFETHFVPFHNRGHHLNVATPDDPATARRGEWVYLFWFRSQIGSYFQAWSIEWQRLKRRKKNPVSLKNNMIVYTIFQTVYLGAMLWFFGVNVTLAYVAGAVFGIILLETVNYIEHYGLLRKKKENGRYERVKPIHSWNSNHIIGRILLFELSRHSDHHFMASKHYQVLDSFDDSPQMPTGYPGMMLLALLPPLWFWIMHKKLALLASKTMAT